MRDITNRRMAKSVWPNGYSMNGCKTPGVIIADVIDTETHKVLYTGPVEMCRGMVEITG